MRRQLATVSIGDTTIPLEEPHQIMSACRSSSAID